MTGIQETKQAIIALAKLGKFVAAQAKDGFQWTDATALAGKLMQDEAFRAALIEGFQGAQNIPAEIRDVQFEEGIEIAMALIAELKAA